MFIALMVAGIALAAFLAFAGERLHRIAIVAAVVGLLAVAAIVLGYILNVYTAQQLIESYVDNVAQAAGLSPLVTKAVTIALVLPVLGATAWSFSQSQQKRLFGRFALAALASAYFLGLWIVTKEQKVSRDGIALQCFVVQEDRVAWRDIRYAGVDPETGRPCEEPKPYMLPMLARLDRLLRSGKQLQPINPQGRFFSAIGDPIVWFHERAENDFVFYDAPGTDPSTGDALAAVIKEVVARWQEHQEKERLATLRNLVTGVPSNAPDNGLGLSIVADRPDDRLDRLAAERLPGALARAAPARLRVFPDMFAKDFVDDGHFAAVMSGSTAVLSDSNAFSQVRYAAFGTTRSDCTSSDSVGAVKSCMITFSFRVYGESGIIAGETAIETGPGFSDDGAVRRGVDLLVERWGDRFFDTSGK